MLTNSLWNSSQAHGKTNRPHDIASQNALSTKQHVARSGNLTTASWELTHVFTHKAAIWECTGWARSIKLPKTASRQHTVAYLAGKQGGPFRWSSLKGSTGITGKFKRTQTKRYCENQVRFRWLKGWMQDLRLRRQLGAWSPGPPCIFDDLPPSSSRPKGGLISRTRPAR